MIENKGELDDSKSELISTADTQCIGMTAFCLWVEEEEEMPIPVTRFRRRTDRVIK
jgi:hypothetical protein